MKEFVLFVGSRSGREQTAAGAKRKLCLLTGLSYTQVKTDKLQSMLRTCQMLIIYIQPVSQSASLLTCIFGPSPCSVIVPAFCYLSSAVIVSPALMLLALSSSRCSVFVSLLCHRLPALSYFSPLCYLPIIVSLLCHPPKPPSAIFPLLCHCAFSSVITYCSVIDPLLCHRQPPSPDLSKSPCSVIVPWLCHHFPALSSSPCSVVISRFCVNFLLCHHPSALSSEPSSSGFRAEY